MSMGTARWGRAASSWRSPSSPPSLEGSSSCMRADRRSAYEQLDLSLPEALVNEHRGGIQVLMTESLAGAQEFAAGAGRHGEFKKPDE